MEKPNDQRNFVHGRIIGAIKGGLSGGIGGAIGGAISGGGRRRGGQPTAPGRRFVNPQRLTKAQRRAQGGLIPSEFGITAFANTGPCPKGTIMGSGGCVSPSSPRGLAEAGGAVVMGRFGAGYVPSEDMRLTRECLPGDVLGWDNICYPKGSISNKERKYPRGTRPLGTPGEMAALRKAASFGRRMETTVKRMQKIGVLKKPGRRPAPKQQQLRLPPGSPSIINVE